MSFKSIIGKVFGKKATAPDDATQVIDHEISFGPTIIENSLKIPHSNANEIEIFLNNVKTDIHRVFTDTTIGRDPSQAQIAIPELTVSKLHCTLVVKDKDVYIKDADSTNGTFVNGRRITEHLLEDNDMISLGKKGIVRIIFHKAGEN